jgi:hypothetical protein
LRKQDRSEVPQGFDRLKQIALQCFSGGGIGSVRQLSCELFGAQLNGYQRLAGDVTLGQLFVELVKGWVFWEPLKKLLLLLEQRHDSFEVERPEEFIQFFDFLLDGSRSLSPCNPAKKSSEHPSHPAGRMVLSALPFVHGPVLGGDTRFVEQLDGLYPIEVALFPPILEMGYHFSGLPFCRGFSLLPGEEALKSGGRDRVGGGPANFPFLQSGEFNWQTGIGECADRLALTQRASRAPGFQLVNHGAQLFHRLGSSHITRAPSLHLCSWTFPG